MNLDAFSAICRLAQMQGLDLWRYRTDKGIGGEVFSLLDALPAPSGDVEEAADLAV
jgi:hypothetical protein